MKHYILFSLLTVCLCGCKEMIKDESAETVDEVQVSSATKDTKEPPIKVTTSKIARDEKDLIGYWVGMFEPDEEIEAIYTGEAAAWNYSNKINISIDEIDREQVKGHSVVAGSVRPFTGTMILKDNTYTFSLKEPGDDKYDGEFHFTIIKNDSVLNGKWSSYKKLAISKRVYSLSKSIFSYDPSLQMNGAKYIDWQKTSGHDISPDDDYDITYFTTTDEVYKYNASQELLTGKQVANMTKADIFVMRNAIYARHGYSFKNRQLRAFFDAQPWYIPVKVDVKAELTEIEKKNIEVLMRYEKNAKEYYDEFGRG